MATIETRSWGKTDGKDVFLYTLRNRNGMEMKVTNYGAIVQSLMVPGAYGLTDVVLGYDTLEDYVDDPYYIGAIVGRYSGRIANGNISIKGVPHQLTITGQGFHHHGGKKGFNKMVWTAEPFRANGEDGLKLHYLSKDKEEGFPGNLHVSVIYLLNDFNEWEVEISATTDQATVLNLTQHSYFNLDGYTETASTIMDHSLTMYTNSYLPVNEKVLPTGEIASVVDTPFDFSESQKIGQRATDDHQQLKLGYGYDHTYVLKRENNDTLALAAALHGPVNNMNMQVYTTEPSVHLYAGNFLDAGYGKKSISFKKHAGLCLETQHFGDSPNQPHFPSTVLEPGEQFKSTTVYKFGQMK